MRWLIAVAALVGAMGCGARTGLESESDEAFAGAPDGAPPRRTPPGCKPDATSVFLLTARERILSFDPPTLRTRPLGVLRCPTTARPNSMTVARDRTAYVGYTGGALFRIDTQTMACEPTAFDTRQLTFDRYGMGFVAAPDGRSETLYVAQNKDADDFSPGLETIDRSSFELTFVAPFDPPLHRVELTGTGDGRLFGYTMDAMDSRLVTIDRTRGVVSTVRRFDFGGAQTAFDFAFWGGDFFLFVSEQPANSTVWRYTPGDDRVRVAGTLDNTIVGAGVTTCAPL